jgi:acetolactate synthase-1/2/3 large subunit
MGPRGFIIQSPDQMTFVLKQAFDTPGPVLIGVHVDYRHNHKLFEQVNERSVH